MDSAQLWRNMLCDQLRRESRHLDTAWAKASELALRLHAANRRAARLRALAVFLGVVAMALLVVVVTEA